MPEGQEAETATPTPAQALSNLAKEDLALALGVLETAAANVEANPTALEAVTQIGGLPVVLAQAVPQASTLGIGGLASLIKNLAAAEKAKLAGA